MVSGNTNDTQRLISEVSKCVEQIGVEPTIEALETKRKNNRPTVIFNFIVDLVCDKYKIANRSVISTVQVRKQNHLFAVKFICYFLKKADIKERLATRANRINRSVRTFERYAKEMEPIRKDKAHPLFKNFMEFEKQISLFLKQQTK